MKIILSVASLFCCLANACGQAGELNAYHSTFENELKTWAVSFNDFRPGAFKRNETRAFETISFGDTTGLQPFYSLYKPALAFSPDSAQFIDIYSYQLGLERSGDSVVANVDVDEAIILCNLITGKRTRIAFCGPSSGVEEVVWLDNKSFILAGRFRGEDDKFHPKIWVGDITSRQFLIYTDDTSVSTKEGYESPKLKALNISPGSY